MKTRTITTQYACCQKRATIRALVALPRETYTRRCSDCETTYRVTRTTLDRSDVIIDILDWVDTKSSAYERKYGSN